MESSRGTSKALRAKQLCRNTAIPTVLGLSISIGIAAPAGAAPAESSFLGHVHRHTTLASTVSDSGDQNPYAVIVAPVSAGKVHKGDVLIDNFNGKKNLQATGSTIVDYNPATRQVSLFAALPRHLKSCPGGVGLTTAMAMLKSGWVIVGSLPSEDGTTATKGQGCLIVLDSSGRLAETIAGPDIDGPWGNVAVHEEGSEATLFVSNTGFGVGAPGQEVVKKATVLRIDLAIPGEGPPVVKRKTVIASGFGEHADKDVFIVGPTGLALAPDGVLYVSDALGNRVAAIPNALTRTDDAGTGETVTEGGLLKRPLAMAMAPNGHLLVTNGLNGQVVEIDPVARKQVAAQWIDTDRAQQPPGSGDLFGIAITPSGDGFYYVEDDMNTLVLAH